MSYLGRFAPSPTGPLHMGSLVAAVGSYLRARAQDGIWLVRMEDVDALREVPGAAADILKTLEAHGLWWDKKVVYQSQRTALYEEAMQQLLRNGLAYACTCSRKYLKRTAVIGEEGIIYPGNCRSSRNAYSKQVAIRVRTNDEAICFSDGRLGRHCQQLESEVGDFIIRRSDGFFAYQLAVVVDDEDQQITEVVRGEDLLGNTQRQMYLQHLLAYKQPDYFHLPLMHNELGQKLSKQTHAPALESTKASLNLLEVLTFLNIYDADRDGPDIQYESPEAMLQWAVMRYK